MSKQQPRLMRGGLSGRVFVVTRYKDLGGGTIEALEKFDVTDDYNALADAGYPPKIDGVDMTGLPVTWRRDE